MSTLKKFIISITLVIILLTTASCAMTVAAPIEDIIGTYELTRYTAQQVYDSKFESVQAEPEDKMQTECVKIYLVIVSADYGYYIYKDASSDIYCKACALVKQYDSEKTNLISHIDLMFGPEKVESLKVKNNKTVDIFNTEEIDKIDTSGKTAEEKAVVRTLKSIFKKANEDRKELLLFEQTAYRVKILGTYAGVRTTVCRDYSKISDCTDLSKIQDYLGETFLVDNYVEPEPIEEFSEESMNEE